VKNKTVGPYVMKLVEAYRSIPDPEDITSVIIKESAAHILMSRTSYRLCLEANYPDLYKELKEVDFLYIKRD